MTKTWLTKYHFNLEILPNNYLLYRNDRETRGGGVLIAANQNVPSRPFEHISTKIEHVTVELLTDPITIVCGVYVPPNSSPSYLDDVLTYINSLPKTRDIIILGDFNSPDIDWYSLAGTTSFTQDFCDLLFENNFSQLVTSPTHIPVHGNLLDLVLTNVPNRIVNISTDYDLSISDHYPIIFHLETNPCTYRREQDQTRNLYNYHKTDQTQLFHELQVLNHIFIATSNMQGIKRTKP